MARWKEQNQANALHLELYGEHVCPIEWNDDTIIDYPHITSIIKSGHHQQYSFIPAVPNGTHENRFPHPRCQACSSLFGTCSTCTSTPATPASRTRTSYQTTSRHESTAASTNDSKLHNHLGDANPEIHVNMHHHTTIPAAMTFFERRPGCSATRNPEVRQVKTYLRGFFKKCSFSMFQYNFSHLLFVSARESKFQSTVRSKRIPGSSKCWKFLPFHQNKTYQKA